MLINQVIFTVYDTIQFLLCFYEIFTYIAFIVRLLFLILKCLLVHSCKIFTHAFLRRWLVFSIYKMLTLSLIIFHLTLQPWYCKNGFSVVVDLACISRYTVYFCMWKEVKQTWFLLKLEEMTLILSRNAKWNVHFTSIPSKTNFRTWWLVEASFWELILGALLNILFFICSRYTFYGIMHNMSKYILYDLHYVWYNVWYVIKTQ